MICNKTKFSLILLCAFSFSLFGQTRQAVSSTTEIGLYSEITAAYKSKSYPSVVEYSSQFEQQYGRSLYLGQVLSYEGESLFKLGRVADASDVIDRALLYCADNPKLMIGLNYWKGRTLYDGGNYRDALASFHTACGLSAESESSKDKKINWYNDQSIMYAGESFALLGMHADAIPLLRYVVSNGKKYSMNEYEVAIQQLFYEYNAVGSYELIISTYEALPPQSKDILADSYEVLALSAGDSYVKSGAYKKAYDCYASVLSGGKSEYASVALQKAYIVSADHPREVGQDPATVLSNAKDTLREYPELVTEFWVRLGIDAYNNGNYAKAKSCFANAEPDADNSYKQLIGLYRADMKLREEKSAHPKDAAAILDDYAKKTTLASSDDYYYAYLNSSIRYAALSQQWNEVEENAPAAINAGTAAGAAAGTAAMTVEETTYWYAVAAYKNREYEKTVDLLAKQTSYRAMTLRARAAAKLQKYSASEAIYKQLDEQNTLTVLDRLDYAKVLLREGYVSSSYKQAVQINTPEAWYVTALASFNRKDWVSAELYFKKYCTTQGSYLSYALFYCGYAQYRLGKTAEAYATLVNFTTKYPTHELAWNSHMTAANAAIQNAKFDLAAREAESAVKLAADGNSASEQKQSEQAVILCATIYMDSGNYGKAISLLEPYTKQTNEFGMRACYQTAQVYAKQGSTDDGDKMFGVVADRFKSNALADDASYRRGELYYSTGDYNKAITRFDSYRKLFPTGSFVDASYFYEADCYSLIGQNDKSILMYLTLIKSSPKSSYCYNAKKNLIASYKKEAEYGEALSIAQSLLDEYSGEAKKDNIAVQISELKRLASGEDEQIVKQRIAYENAGGLATIEGRVAGTKLAGMLWKNSSQQESVALAQQLYPLQTSKQNEAKESRYAAQTALIIAQSLRQSEKNKEAAENYLSAAQYARMNKDVDDVAARALYGAVEAFDAAGMDGDAKSTADTLAKLYPQNSFTAQANAIVAEE